MKVDQEEVKDFVEKKGRKYVIDNVITRCPTNCLSLKDDDTLEVDNRNCVKCMHCLNVMPKALSPGDDKGAPLSSPGLSALGITFKQCMHFTQFLLSTSKVSSSLRDKQFVGHLVITLSITYFLPFFSTKSFTSS